MCHSESIIVFNQDHFMKFFIIVALASFSLSSFAVDRLGMVDIKGNSPQELSEKCDDMATVTAKAILAERAKHVDIEDEESVLAEIEENIVTDMVYDKKRRRGVLKGFCEFTSL